MAYSLPMKFSRSMTRTTWHPKLPIRLLTPRPTPQLGRTTSVNRPQVCKKARRGVRAMIPEIGHFALILALSLALLQGILPLVGAHSK